MNQLVVTLIVIFLPGIIGAVVCDKLAVHSKWDSFKFSLYALVLGMCSYISLQIIFYIRDLISVCPFQEHTWSHLKIWGAAVKESTSIPAYEVFFATILSLPVSFFIVYLINYKIFNRIAKKLGVSYKYGDENLFSYYLNAKEVDWLYIRDKENGLTYQGRIVMYSENDQMQEIVLSEVTVFTYAESEELYSVPTIYLTKPSGKFIIETIPADYLGV